LVHPEKGHSHGPLDAVYGQATVKLGNSEFDDDKEVVALLQKFLDDGALERGLKVNAVAYKLDQAAKWVEWAEADLQIACTNLTGKGAPHSFHICLRQDLSQEELCAERTAWPEAPPLHCGDLVVALRGNMADRKASQVALLAPHQVVERFRLGHRAQAQPEGIHARRPFALGDRHKVARQAEKCYALKAISGKSRDYLRDWSKGTLRQHKRPPEYGFLWHRWSENAAEDYEQLAPKAARYLHPKWDRPLRPIKVVESRAAVLPPEPVEDAGDAPLLIVQDAME
jgi:hypothetical protein